jgi:hypothetical protein
MTQTSIAMSRSQSARSEVVDLTEDSEKEVENIEGEMQSESEMKSEEMESEGEIYSSEPKFGESPVENQLEPHEEKGDESASQEDDILDVESDEFEVEDGEGYEDFEDHRYPPGFRPVNHTENNAWSDDENSPEDDEEYDEDYQSEGESVPAITKQLTRAEPEVIDLLSSDEEQDEDVNDRRDKDDRGDIDGGVEARPRVTNETPTRALVRDDLPNETGEDGDHEEDNFSDTGHRVQGLEDEDHESQKSGDQGFQYEDHESQESEDQNVQDEEAHSQPVDRQMPCGDSGDNRNEATNSDIKVATIDNQQGVFDGNTYAEEEIKADNKTGSPKTSPAPIYLSVESEYDCKTQSDGRQWSLLSNDQNDSSQGDDISGNRSIPGEPSNETRKEQEPLYLDGTNELSPVDITYPVPPPEQNNTEIREHGMVLEKDTVNKYDNGQLPTPNATQLTEVILREVSFGSTSTVQQLPFPQSQSQIQEGSVTAAVEDVEMTLETGRYSVSGNAPQSPAATDILKVAPTTPINAHNAISIKPQNEKADSSSPMIVDDPNSPQGYDASAELAIAALDSPTKQDQTPALSDTALRALLNRSLRTNLGEFTALSLVRFSLEKKLDILAIVTNHPPEPQRAKVGPRHFHLRFNVTDPSIAPKGVTEIQIFRPHKAALPVVQPGDGVLIRNFRVKSERNRGFALRSEDNSSWLVFKQDGREEIPGPPVELGDGEREHMVRLKTWYIGLNEIYKEKLERANGDKGVGKKAVGKPF